MVMSRDLLLREPAMALLVGALPQGDNFGFGGYGYGYGFGGPSFTPDPALVAKVQAQLQQQAAAKAAANAAMSAAAARGAYNAPVYAPGANDPAHAAQLAANVAAAQAKQAADKAAANAAMSAAAARGAYNAPKYTPPPEQVAMVQATLAAQANMAQQAAADKAAANAAMSAAAARGAYNAPKYMPDVNALRAKAAAERGVSVEQIAAEQQALQAQAEAIGRANAAAAAVAAMGPGGMASTQARTLLLDPNRDSTVKVERYSFSFSPAANLVLGAAANIPTFTQQPSTSIKGQRVVMNAPVPGFILISTLQIANVNVLVGGTEDAFTYNARGQGVMLDLPRLDPQNRATSAGAYTGVLPPGYVAGASFQFIVTLQGPATLAGGYGQ